MNISDEVKYIKNQLGLYEKDIGEKIDDLEKLSEIKAREKRSKYLSNIRYKLKAAEFKMYFNITH